MVALGGEDQWAMKRQCRVITLALRPSNDAALCFIEKAFEQSTFFPFTSLLCPIDETDFADGEEFFFFFFLRYFKRDHKIFLRNS